MPEGSTFGRRSQCGSQVQHCPAIKAACARAIETNSCLSSLTPRAVSEFWKWPLARQTDSQFWTHSKSTDCMGREVNREQTEPALCLPGNKRHHIPSEPEKPVPVAPQSRFLLPVRVRWAHLHLGPSDGPAFCAFPAQSRPGLLSGWWWGRGAEGVPAFLKSQRFLQSFLSRVPPPTSHPTCQQWHLLQASSAL